MATYEAVVDEEGRIRLPAELTGKVGARPGDTLDVTELRPLLGEFARSLSIQVFSNRRAMEAGRRDTTGGLDALKAIARLAREDGARPSAADDPIGDFLVDEDRRSRSR